MKYFLYLIMLFPCLVLSDSTKQTTTGKYSPTIINNGSGNVSFVVGNGNNQTKSQWCTGKQVDRNDKNAVNQEVKCLEGLISKLTSNIKAISIESYYAPSTFAVTANRAFMICDGAYSVSYTGTTGIRTKSTTRTTRTTHATFLIDGRPQRLRPGEKFDRYSTYKITYLNFDESKNAPIIHVDCRNK